MQEAVMYRPKLHPRLGGREQVGQISLRQV